MAKPDDPKAKSVSTSKAAEPDGFLDTALKRADRAFQREKENIREAYEDLEFRVGDQWPDYAKIQRVNEKRPILTINRIPQFVHQVTGDMRLMKPSIKAVPVDSRGSEEVAELISGMIRYVENRSEAVAAYSSGAEAQVTCGMGAWRVTTEYAEETTFNQEIRIRGVDDSIAVLWDPDASLPTREDAMWCLVPVDMSRESFEEKYPDIPVSEFSLADQRYLHYWFGADFVRVAEYWEKRPEKRRLALLPDGGIDDLSGDDGTKEAELVAAGARIEDRDGHCIYRSLITIGSVLEQPKAWPGRMIPIVPVVGEEVHIGRKVYRHGIVRFAKDAQRMYNFARSAQTEMVALAPKAPWIGTAQNFKEDLDKWESSNVKNWPALIYTPDPRNGGREPTRVNPPVTSPGLSELVMVSDNDMKSTTGIYDASLGRRSNETSGVAIQARQHEGDVGTVVYSDNYSLAIRHTGRILVDLIPHVYDTERMIQVVGEDGKTQNVVINKAMVPPPQVGFANEEDDEAEGTPSTGPMMNDVTIGAYGITVEVGPAYSTRREEAKAGMTDMLKAAPETFPLIGDLYARAQDWPLAKDIGERLELLLPPPIRMAMEAKKQGGQMPMMPPGMPLPGGPPGGQPPMPPGPPPPPPPELIAKMHAEQLSTQADVAKAQASTQGLGISHQIKLVDLEIARVNLAIATANAQAKMIQPAGIMEAQKPPDQQPGNLQALTQHLVRMQGMIDELVAAQIHGAASNGSIGALLHNERTKTQ